MKKPRRESPREEAVRQDALEHEGSLDDLPFTRLRRYAKEPSQVYAMRIPVSRLEAIRWLADQRDEQPTALLREWVLERLDDELVDTASGTAMEVPTKYKTARPRPARKTAKKGKD